MRFFFWLIHLYQVIFPFLKSGLGFQSGCIFSPSCSEYTKQSIRQYGLFKGIRMGLNQLKKCHPFHRL